MKGPHKVQQMEVQSPQTGEDQPYVPLYAGQVESSCKVSGIPENIRLNINQQCALVTKKTNGILSYSRRSIFNRSEGSLIFSLYSAPGVLHPAGLVSSYWT